MPTSGLDISRTGQLAVADVTSSSCRFKYMIMWT